MNTMATRTEKTRRPTHPGAVLRDCLPDTGLSTAEVAAALGVPRRRLARLLDGGRMTPDMAHRLARALGTSPDVWMRMQIAVELWEAEAAAGAEYARIERVTATPPPVG